jgi:FAD synthetase
VKSPIETPLESGCTLEKKKDNVFDEVEQFIQATEQTHGLEIVRFRCSFKEGCQRMVQQFGIKAFLLGTRKSDPHGGYVEFFSPSTPGWPV